MSDIVPSSQLFPEVPDTELVKYSGFGYSHNRFLDMYLVIELLSQEGYLILPSKSFCLDFTPSIMELPADWTGIGSAIQRYKVKNIPNDFEVDSTFPVQDINQVSESFNLINKEIYAGINNGGKRRVIFAVKRYGFTEFYGLDKVLLTEAFYSVDASLSHTDLRLTGQYLNVTKKVIDETETEGRNQLPEYKQIEFFQEN